MFQYKKKNVPTCLMIILISVLMTMGCAVGVFAEQTKASAERLYDDGDLLSDAEEALIRARLDGVSERLGFDILIVTADDCATADDYTMISRADYYYDNSLVYLADDAAILVMDISGECYIRTYGRLGDKIEEELDRFRTPVKGSAVNGKYKSACESFVSLCDEIITDASSFDLGKNLVISIIVGVVAALITVLGMIAKLKTVGKKTNASDYVRQGSMVINERRDIFLYRTVRRIPKPKNTSSGKGGGHSGHRGGGRL